MTMQAKILLVLGGLVVVGGAIAAYMYFKPHKDYGASTPDVTVAVADLLRDFTADERAAGEKYVAEQRVVLVRGTVAEIVLNDDGTSRIDLREDGIEGVVSCTMVEDEHYDVNRISRGMRVGVQGECTGMQELVEPEVIMIRCVLEK